MEKFRYVLYIIYTLSKYLIITKIIPKTVSTITDIFSNLVTIYLFILGSLTVSYLIFPEQCITILGKLLGVVNEFHLIWTILGIGIIQLILKHKKFIISDLPEKIKWWKALQSASLESAGLILLMAGSIIQLTSIFLPTGNLLVEVIAYGLLVKLYWFTRSRWIYSTIRFL